MSVRIDQLGVPVIGAPMAGGASTPELVAAVNGVGGLGFLAAGYKSADAMAEQVRQVRNLTDRPFGVNLFVPAAPSDPAVVAAYREVLLPEAERWGVRLPAEIAPDRDDWDAKVETLLADPVAVVSYTFGLPPADVRRALSAAGTTQVGTVTSLAEARAAAESGMDALCVQGPEAGGHRGTHRADAEPGDVPLLDLLAAVRREVRLPLIAAGGVGDGTAVAAAVRAGAAAVQLGTALLRCDESGASAAHRAALVDDRFQQTVVTRAFTGRPARGLRNAFTDRYSSAAPRAYPEVHHLTQPLRAAAGRRGDTGSLHLWAGTAHRAARSGPAATVVSALLSVPSGPAATA